MCACRKRLGQNAKPLIFSREPIQTLRMVSRNKNELTCPIPAPILAVQMSIDGAFRSTDNAPCSIIVPPLTGKHHHQGPLEWLARLPYHERLPRSQPMTMHNRLNLNVQPQSCQKPVSNSNGRSS
jgi:hypothetical protein